MSHLLSDETLLDDMAACLKALRGWLMEVAENHPEMDTAAIDELSEQETEHVVLLEVETFSVQHPLRERVVRLR